jgi:hypothetical protein
MMRKIPVFFAFFLFAGTTSSDGAFIIQLTDGGEYRTSRYWSEGSEIKFFVCGGILGVPRGDVQHIQKIPASDDSPGEDTRDFGLCAPKPQSEGQLLEKELAPEGADEDKSPSPTFFKYQQAVNEFAKKLMLISGMSKQELGSLAGDAKALRNNMLSEQDVVELRPLLNVVYDALDQIDTALVGKDG